MLLVDIIHQMWTYETKISYDFYIDFSGNETI